MASCKAYYLALGGTSNVRFSWSSAAPCMVPFVIELEKAYKANRSHPAMVPIENSRLLGKILIAYNAC